MNKKYQVFVSSTYKDLQEARAKVRDAILSMYHFPVGMELFGAANEEQWQIISETIDSCPASVGVQMHPLLHPAGCIVPCIIVCQISQLNPHVLIQSMRISFCIYRLLNHNRI